MNVAVLQKFPTEVVNSTAKVLHAELDDLL